MNDEDLLDYLQLARAQNIGPVTFVHLIKRFGSAKEALIALPELTKRGGSRSIKLGDRSSVEKEVQRAKKLNIHIITFDNPLYPQKLRTIEGSPPVVCVRGNLSVLQKPAIGMVGARNASTSGRKIARILAAGVGQSGYVTVSGLARGIDSAVHEASLNMGTIAALAGGVDIVYPPENENLYDKIQENGCIISEMPIGFMPRAVDFPRRNRIIAGLSQAVVVVEATERSGSLITARLGLEMNIEVCAVPGSPLDPRASGTNKLLRDGATLVTNVQDILDALNAPKSRVQMDFGFAELENDTPYKSEITQLNRVQNDEFHSAILNALSYAPVELDTISRELQVPISNISSAILELELAGMVERVTGNRVCLISE